MNLYMLNKQNEMNMSACNVVVAMSVFSHMHQFSFSSHMFACYRVREDINVVSF